MTAPTTPAMPDTPEALTELMMDTTRFRETVNHHGGLKQFNTAYVAQFNKADRGLTEEQVNEIFQRQIVDYLKDEDNADVLKRLNLSPTNRNTPAARSAAYNPQAPGAAVDDAGIFNSNAEFLKTIWHENKSPDAIALQHRMRNDFSSVVPSDGGFLVPESFRSQLLQEQLEASLIRPRAMVIPMETARVSFPALETTSHAASVYGGMIAYWTEEAARLTKASAKFSKVTLDAKKLTGYSVIPNELLADSIISLEGFINQAWPRTITWTEDLGFINGTGVGEPLGVMRAGAAVSVAKESGQAAGSIVWDNIIKMYARMLPTSLGNAIWLANINTFPQLATMALEVGTGGSAVWLNNGVEGPPASILGRPVIFTEKLPTVGTQWDIAFVDLSYYMIGDRQTMQMATSTDIEFDTDQTAYRIISRVDGRPWLNTALTPNQGSDTLSPFVTLATRA